MKKIIRLCVFILLGVLLIAELVGRYYGLCTYPLYQADDHYEYSYLPNQQLKIYRNNFSTNQYAMRSQPFNAEKDTNSVLFIGDSVINGGNMTDNDSLCTSILEKLLNNADRNLIRVLNISAGSWGPDNGAEFIKKHGYFNAKMIVLVVSSHDANDNITGEEVVGIHPQYPNENKWFAVSKLYERGLQTIHRKLGINSNPNQGNKLLGISNGKEFNSGFDFFRKATDSLKIPFLVYVHCTKKEISTGQLNAQGQTILDYCKKYKIRTLNELDLQVKKSFYRDGIHYNNSGQQFIARNTKAYIEEQLLASQIN